MLQSSTENVPVENHTPTRGLTKEMCKCFRFLYHNECTRTLVFNLGTKWYRIPGSLKQIAAGPKGIVVGVDKARKIYYRAGVSSGKPMGTRWVRIPGRLNQVVAGCSGIFGLSMKGEIFRYRGIF